MTPIPCGADQVCEADLKSALRNSSTLSALCPRAARVLALLIALGLLIRVGHWHPGIGADDTRYMNYAAAMARGESPGAFVYDTAAVRLAYEATLAAAMLIFGQTTTVCSLVSLATFALTAVLLYRLTSRLSDAWAGLAAVFLYDLLPVDVPLSTQVLPDSLMTALALAAALCYLRAVEGQARRERLTWSLATGVVLGLAMSVKEPAFCAGLVFAVHFASTRPGLRTWLEMLAMMALGAAAVFGLELVGFWLWTGDPLYRSHAVNQGMQRIEPGQKLEAFSLKEAAFYLIAASNVRDAFGVHFYLIAAAVLPGLNRGNRALAFPLVWCVVFGLYLSVGSLSLSEYIMVPHRPRYFLPVAVVGCGIAAIELVELKRRLAIRPWVTATAAVLLTAFSLRAALIDPPSGMIPTAEWLADRERPRFVYEPVVPAEPGWGQVKPIALLKSFVERQALERRAKLLNFPRVEDGIVRSPAELTKVLTQHCLVVPVFEGYDGITNIAKSTGIMYQGWVYGPAWPPYFRWLGVGEEYHTIASVWHARSAESMDHP